MYLEGLKTISNTNLYTYCNGINVLYYIDKSMNHKESNYNFHKNIDIAHLKRMRAGKVKYVYHHVMGTEAKEIPPFQMLQFLLDNYPHYCRTIQEGIKFSYKHHDNIFLVGIQSKP